MGSAALVSELNAVLEYLTPEEQREVDEHILALTVGQAHVEYQNDPISWAVDKLGIPRETIEWSLNPGYDVHEWDGTPDPIAAMFRAIADWKDCGVESATGTGKSFGAAVLILWFLACFENALAFTFAPKEDQLKLFIWKNITELWPRFRAHFPSAELTDLTLRMRGGIDESWAAHGYAVGIKVGEAVSTKASGMHAKHMLLVYEEGAGQPPQVMAAGENACTAPHNLRLDIGNPNNQLDPLHKFCLSPGVVHIRASGLDHPNVVTGDANLIPGAVSQVSITRRLLAYGETSPVYQSRVRGVSPEQASDALIRLEWLTASAQRFAERVARATLPTVVTGKGVDVANSEHGDRACIADFADNALVRLEAFQCPDANALGRRIALEMQGLPAYRVGVDPIGVGAGTVNELRRLRQGVQGVNFGALPVGSSQKAPDGGTYDWAPDANKFKNLRSQAYWQLREDLRLNTIDIREDRELWEELTAPTFVDEPKTVVEPKDEIRDRLGRSPDKADAVVIANWVRARKSLVVTALDAKLPHRAASIVVRDGRAVPRPPQAHTLEALVAQAERRMGRLPHAERLPRRKYG